MKQKKLSLTLLLMLISFTHLFAQKVLETTNNQDPKFIIDENEQIVTIHNENFEKFLNGIVQDALTYGKQALLSQALLRCYECMMHDQKEVYMQDLQEALPELLGIAAIYCQEQNEARAPRPGQHFQENEIVGPGTCDLSSVVQLLHQLLTALNKCCANLQSDFQQTWTILASLNLSTTLMVDISGIFTVLADIDATLTACCENITREFQETWTILNAGFNGTFSAIQGFNADTAGTFSVLADINNSLTICCDNITREFQETWTILAAFSSPCSPTPITAPTTISTPGFYCLANDIVGSLTITGTDITLDLNNHTISAPGATALIINGAVNTIVSNGKIDICDNGISLAATNNIAIDTISITNCSVSGIVGNTCITTQMSNIILQNMAQYGINFVTTTSIAQFQNISINNAALGGMNFTLLYNALFENCTISDCGVSGNVVGFSITIGADITLANCAIKNLLSSNGNVFAFLFSQCSNVIVNQCSVQDVFAGITTLGTVAFGINFDATTQHVSLENCILHSLFAGSLATGYQLSASDVVANNCLVQTCSSLIGALSNVGFAVDGSNINLTNCQSYRSTNGYAISIPSATLANCEGSFNSNNGFFISNINPLVGKCVAFNNGGVGFNVSVVGTIPMYGCFASQNSTNYVNAPNVVAAATAVAFNNSFI